jgi:hypothetical protein
MQNNKRYKICIEYIVNNKELCITVLLHGPLYLKGNEYGSTQVQLQPWPTRTEENCRNC